MSKFKNKVTNKDLDAAISFIDDEDFYNKERNSLLKELEKGTLLYLNKNYYQALLSFEKAQNISDNLYTISVSKKLQSLLLTNADNYYGERYERSLIRFYESLIHYNLYKQGKYEKYIFTDENKKSLSIPEKILNENEKRKHLFASRAITDEWNSLLNSYINELSGKSTYKTDLTQKLWGAFVNDELGKKQVALQLYKDAKIVLKQNYNVYPSFNLKSEQFDKDFKKLPTLSPQKLNNYIENTDNANILIKFIDRKIEQLTKNEKDNFSIVFKDNFVKPKMVAKIVVGVGLSPIRERELIEEEKKNNVKVIPLIIPVDLVFPVIHILTMYDPELFMFLGLTMYNNNIAGLVYPRIEFEVPFMSTEKNNSNFYTAFLSNDHKRIEIPLALANPIDDIATKNMNDKIMEYSIQTAIKLITLHVGAIRVANEIYVKGKKKGTHPVLLKIATFTAYKAELMLINKLMEADLRYWSTLPANIRIGSANIPTGTYKLNIVDKENKNVYENNDIIIKENKFVDINI
jgi:hypothetical protein